MYGEYSNRLQQRLYTAWRRRRHGSVRDRVLSSLESDGLFTVSNSIAACQSQRDNTTASVQHHSGSLVSEINCQYNVCDTTENGTSVCTHDKAVKSCDTERSCHKLLLLTTGTARKQTSFMLEISRLYFHIY